MENIGLLLIYGLIASLSFMFGRLYQKIHERELRTIFAIKEGSVTK